MTIPSKPLLTIDPNDIDDVVMGCIVSLLQKEPFYGSCLSGMSRVYDSSMKAPAAVTIRNATPILFINPEKFIAFNPLERRAVAKHETLHILLMHMNRRIGRQHKKFNIAADMALNQMINNLPPTAVLPGRYDLPINMPAEFYYDHLESTEKGRDLLKNYIGNDIDSHDEWEEVDDEDIVDSVVRAMTNEALQRGTIPGELKSIIPEILKERRVAWNVLLRNFVATLGKIKRDSSWKKENKRIPDFPGYKRTPGLNLLIAMDTSGSVGDDDIAIFFDEIDNIYADKRNVITIMESDTSVKRVYKYDGRRPKSVTGRGGTHFAPALKAAWELHPRPDGVVYLTDGYGENPDRVNPLSVLWIVTKRGSVDRCARFGKIVRMN